MDRGAGRRAKKESKKRGEKRWEEIPVKKKPKQEEDNIRKNRISKTTQKTEKCKREG